jgi:hypothetical protein
MNRLRKWFQSRLANTGQPASSHLAVEELEARTVLSTLRVVSGIILSSEHFQDFVTQDYLQFLRRTPDPLGLTFWVLQLQRGVAPEVVDAAFVSSGEYIFNHGNTPTNFILGLYSDVLGRAPSNVEVNFWLNQLALGVTTARVAQAFTTSAEREALVISLDYMRFLGRVPDANGLASWLNLIRLFGANQENVEIGIVNSGEFFQRHGNNNSDFIVGVYQTVLHRTPSQAEINFWLGVIGP